MKKLHLLALSLLTISITSCTNKLPSDGPVPADPASKTMKDLVIPSSFDFQTTKEVQLGITVRNSSEVLAGIPVKVYLDYPGTSETPVVTARLLGTFSSKADGMIQQIIKVPANQDSLYLSTKFIGLESQSGFKITGNTASYTFGNGDDLKLAAIPTIKSNLLKGAVAYTFMGEYNAKGRPLYLETPADPISKSFLDDINETLPEKISLPVHKPDYFKNSNVGNVVMKEQSDVYITFVGEGSKFKNALGYYSFKTATPPASVSQITKHTIIFPNASLPGSGGALQTGSKVFLGRFDAGTTIGWFLVANGWDGDAVSGQTIYYSEPSFNPENVESKRQHVVQVRDLDRGLFLLGFEDTNRATGGSDDDFNDVVYYVTSTPVKAVDSDDKPDIEKAKDDDNDGIPNCQDEFPNDATRAHTSYYPCEDQFNGLLAEDLWPSYGDFDFNDLVVDCNFKEISNGAGKIKEMYIRLKVMAVGASFKNGFGIQFPVDPSAIKTVTLKDQSGKISTIGVETGVDKAVIIPFNNAFTLLPSTGSSGVNTVAGSVYREPKEIELYIDFQTPQSSDQLGTAPYNPFIFINGDRSKEVHLAGKEPTSKANSSFFGANNDNTNPSKGVYYKSKNNLIWMLEVPSSFEYTIEKNDITKAYLKFASWAESGGSLNRDWYMDKEGYRDNSLIYSK